MPCGYQSSVSLSPEFQQNAATWCSAPEEQVVAARLALASTSETDSTGSSLSSWAIVGVYGLAASRKYSAGRAIGSATAGGACNGVAAVVAAAASRMGVVRRRLTPNPYGRGD